MSLLARDDVRLLTITGPGGIGKTRLAIEFGRSAIGAFPDGVVFVPLAAISRPDQIGDQITQALGIPETVGVDVHSTVLIALQDSATLLILDNFEHILGAAPFLTELLERCPRLKMLVTSRSLLRVEGEFALPTPPLVLPKNSAVTSPVIVAQSPAIQLFVNRARAVAHTFALTDETAPIVAGICRHLDGLPLALELAAAQIAVLPPCTLLDRIRERLPLPISGPRDAPARLRTMRDTVAWSYDLLTPTEQSLVRRLSVFTGGISLDAAEAMAGGQGYRPEGDSPDGLRGREGEGEETVSPSLSVSPSPPQSFSFVPLSPSSSSVLDILASLVDKSLLQQGDRGDAPRYLMLETIRTFAWEQAVTSGEADAICDAHAEWCLTLTGQNPLSMQVEAQVRRLETEHANLRSALAWFERQDDGTRLLQLAAGLSGFWYAHSHFREGRAWLERALERDPGTSPNLRAPALLGLSRLLAVQAEASRAEPLLAEAIALLRALSSNETLAQALVLHGAVANQLGAFDRAERHLEEALELAVHFGNSELAVVATIAALGNLGVAAHGRGDFALATARHEQALSVSRANGYAVGVTRSYRDLGDVARDQGDYARALAHYRESLGLLEEQGDLLIVVDALEGAALAAAAWHQPERAARLLGAAAALREQFGGGFIVSMDLASHERTEAVIRAAIGDAGLRAAWASGRQLTLAGAVDEVHAISQLETAAARPSEMAAVKLSAREHEVLGLLVSGLSDRAIADGLSVSVRTVEAHVQHILAKLGVRNRSEAAASAVAAGLVKAESPGSP